MDDILGKERNDMNPNIGMKRGTVLLAAIVATILSFSSALILVEDFASSTNAIVFVLILLTNNIFFYAWISLWLIFLGYNEDRRAGIPKEGD